MNNILLGLFFLILGMLIYNILNDVCGCRGLIEGQCTTSSENCLWNNDRNITDTGRLSGYKCRDLYFANNGHKHDGGAGMCGGNNTLSISQADGGDAITSRVRPIDVTPRSKSWW